MKTSLLHEGVLHNFYPFFPGISEPLYTPERLAALNARDMEWDGQKLTRYEVEQKQRAAERNVRKYRRRSLMEAAVGEIDPKTAVKIKEWQAKVRKLERVTGHPAADRVMVHGYGRSQAAKVTWAVRKGFGVRVEEREEKTATVRTQRDIEVLSETADKLLNDAGLKQSKWSGKTIRTTKEESPNAMGLKCWNCDIEIREDANLGTAIHEHLHARSCSHYPPSVYIDNQRIEEGSVELLKQELCVQHNIEYSKSYTHYVRALRFINQLTGAFETDYDFAKKMFDVPLPDRYDWLIDVAENSSCTGDKRKNLFMLVWMLCGGK